MLLFSMFYIYFFFCADVVASAAFVGESLRQYLRAGSLLCVHNLYGELLMFLAKLFSWGRHVLLRCLVEDSMVPAQRLQVNNLVINFGACPATRSMTLLNPKGNMANKKHQQQRQQQPTAKGQTIDLENC